MAAPWLKANKSINHHIPEEIEPSALLKFAGLGRNVDNTPTKASITKKITNRTTNLTTTCRKTNPRVTLNADRRIPNISIPYQADRTINAATAIHAANDAAMIKLRYCSASGQCCETSIVKTCPDMTGAACQVGH
jgi:hypothetical protein